MHYALPDIHWVLYSSKSPLQNFSIGRTLDAILSKDNKISNNYY